MSQDLERTYRGSPVTGAADEAGDMARQDILIAGRRKIGWWQNAWLLPIAAVLLAVMITSDPLFLTFQPAKSGLPLNPQAPGLNFGLIVAHVMFGTVAVVTACLSVWPWLRARHVAVHRWSGRLYVLSALPAALLTLALNFMGVGWQGNVGAFTEGVVWFTTTLIGYVAIRLGDRVRHRRWMLYSFAMAVSVAWGWILTPMMSAQGQFPFLMELVRWVGWLLNLLVVKWWLDRTDRASRVGKKSLSNP